MPHIYWFAYFNPTLPSVRYRAKYPLAYLRRKHGIGSDLVFPGYHPRTIQRFVRMYLRALFSPAKDTVIVVQRVSSNWIYCALLKLLVRLRRPLTIYDLDDAEYLERPPHNIHWFMRNCGRCTVGSTALVDYVRQRNANVHLLTSPVVDHGQVKRQHSAPFTIGWIGCFGGGHKEGLVNILFPALTGHAFKSRLVLLGVTTDRDERLVRSLFSSEPNVELVIPRRIDWQDEIAIHERISQFDVGVAPVLDRPLERAKSAFKLKQYLSCGVPVLGSDTGENARFLQHTWNGFICRTTADYRFMIEHMHELDPDAYARLSRNALASVPAFNMEHYTDLLMDALNLAGSTQGASRKVGRSIERTRS